MTFFYEFNKLVEEVNKKLKDATKSLKTCPKESLRCSKNGNKYIFYGYDNREGKRKRVSLTSDEKTLVELAYKECLTLDYNVLTKAKKILNDANEQLEKLFIQYAPLAATNAINGSPLSLEISTNEWHSQFLKERYPVIAPNVVASSVEMLDEGALWMKQGFTSNPVRFDIESNYVTSRGERVRSRAEYMIAELLCRKGLAYKYECAYENGWRTLYPDFTIMHPRTGKLYYLEYFGMMNDPDYFQKTMEKISLYQNTPDAERFIFIFESNESPLDSQQIENVLDRYFMQ